MNRFLVALFCLSPLLAQGAAFPYITLNKMTNRVSDNGTALTYNGVPIGGGGGGSANWVASGPTNSTLTGVASAGGGIIVGTATNGGWAPLPNVTDMEGGTVYSAENLNFIQNGFVQLSANYLTNFYGGYASVVSIGYNTPDTTSISQGNASVAFIGDYTASGITLTNCYNIYAVAGLSSAAITNSHDVYAIGNNLSSSTIINSHDIYVEGDNSTAQTITVINSSGIFNSGSGSGASAYITNSSALFNFVDGGNGALITNSTVLVNYGLSAGGGAKVTNCSSIFNYGENAGGQDILQNTVSRYTFGFHAGDEANIYSSDGVYDIGSEVGMHNALDHVTHWLDLGFNAGTQTMATNSSNIYALGGLQQATLNNTVDLVTIGQTAGNFISGAYTNVVLVGDGATLGSTGQNLFVLPAGMAIRIGTNTLSVSGTNLVFNGRNL